MRITSSVFAMLTLASVAMAQSLTGLWDASVVVNGLTIPFRMEFSGEGSGVQGSFFNGDERVTSTGGQLENGSLTLRFDHYATRLEAAWKDGVLTGRYDRGSRGSYPFQAKRADLSAQTGAGAPPIGGLWEIEVKSPKGESAWRFIVRQSGADPVAKVSIFYTSPGAHPMKAAAGRARRK